MFAARLAYQDSIQQRERSPVLLTVAKSGFFCKLRISYVLSYKENNLQMKHRVRKSHRVASFH